MKKIDLNSFLVFLLVYPILLIQVLSEKIGFSVTLFQMLFFFIIIILSGRISIDLFKYKQVYILFVFLSVCIISGFLYGDNSDYAIIKRWQIFILIINILSIVLLINNKKRIESFNNLILAYSYLLIILSVVFGNYVDGRLELLGMNPIWLARLFMLACVYNLCLFILNNKYIYLLPTIIFFFFTIKTGSFGPLLSGIITIYYISILILKRTGKSKWLLYLIRASYPFVIALVVYLLFIIYHLTGDKETLISFFYRKEMFIQALTEQRDILFGLGLGNFHQLGYMAEVFLYPHNIYFEAYIEMGVIGLIIILTFVITSNIKIKTTDRDSVLIKSGFVFFFLNSLFSGDLMVGNINIYIFSLLLYKIEKYNNKHILKN